MPAVLRVKMFSIGMHCSSTCCCYRWFYSEFSHSHARSNSSLLAVLPALANVTYVDLIHRRTQVSLLGILAPCYLHLVHCPISFYVCSAQASTAHHFLNCCCIMCHALAAQLALHGTPHQCAQHGTAKLGTAQSTALHCIASIIPVAWLLSC